MMSTLHLLVVEDEQGKREIALVEEEYSLGRSAENDIRLHSLFVGRRHATLIRRQREDGSYYYQVIDGNPKTGKPSPGGIIINGRKLQVHALKNEDKIVFAPQLAAIYYEYYKLSKL